jgi:hypothetical protein
MGSPKIPTPQVAPPPPSPAMLAPRLPGGVPNLGGTFLTSGMPSAPPIAKPAKTLLGG